MLNIKHISGSMLRTCFGLVFFKFLSYLDKYSICLYFKTWLLNSDHENEHIQLYLPSIDQSYHIIRCDLQEILIDPHHHINHERFVNLFFYYKFDEKFYF